MAPADPWTRRPWPWLLALLVVLTAVRLVVAAGTSLAPDEAYYWVWSRALAPGYFDHPPMVALWIRLGTAIAGPNALGIRLLGPVSALLGSLLLADAGERLFPGRNAGVTAAVLLNATLLFGVGTVIMTPDTPLLFFWTACLWAMARLVRGGRPAWWLAAGLFAGLALASKYTAVLLPVGIGLWLLVVPAQRRWLRRPMPWIGALLAALVFLPVVLWNAHHGWASFVRQGGRVANWEPNRAPQFFGELIGGQFGLATPVVFVLCIAGAAAAARHAWRRRDPGWTLLAMLILPGTVIFMQHAIGARVQGNWPAILYPAAILAAGGLETRFWRRWCLPGAVFGLAMTGLVYAQAGLVLIPLPVRLDPTARQLRGWEVLAAQVASAAHRRHAAFVAAEQYGLASELAYTLPRGMPVAAVGSRWSCFALPPARTGTGEGLLIWPGNGPNPDPARWPGAQLVAAAGRGTLQLPIQAFRLYEVPTLPRAAPAVLLPRR